MVVVGRARRGRGSSRAANGSLVCARAERRRRDATFDGALCDVQRRGDRDRELVGTTCLDRVGDRSRAARRRAVVRGFVGSVASSAVCLRRSRGIALRHPRAGRAASPRSVDRMELRQPVQRRRLQSQRSARRDVSLRDSIVRRRSSRDIGPVRKRFHCSSSQPAAAREQRAARAFSASRRVHIHRANTLFSRHADAPRPPGAAVCVLRSHAPEARTFVQRARSAAAIFCGAHAAGPRRCRRCVLLRRAHRAGLSLARRVSPSVAPRRPITPFEKMCGAPRRGRLSRATEP